MMATTLEKIRKRKPCSDRWKKLLCTLGKKKADNEELPLERILKSNGINDALWALRAVDGHESAIRLYACYCAKRVLPIYEKLSPEDKRVRACIEAAESFAYGISTREEMRAAREVVRSSIRDGAQGTVIEAVRAAANAAAKAAASDDVQVAVWTATIAVTSVFAWEAVEKTSRVVVWRSTAKYATKSDALYALWRSAWRAAQDDFSREFLRLCRLEGEYGTISRVESAQTKEKEYVC